MVAEKPLTKAEIEAMVQRAATCGAKQALAAVGLHDEHAAADVKELRSVLEAWRSTKTTAATAAIKFLTTAFLAAIVAWLSWTWTQQK
jgi:2-iminoacetate synthase ThiH